MQQTDRGEKTGELEWRGRFSNGDMSKCSSKSPLLHLTGHGKLPLSKLSRNFKTWFFFKTCSCMADPL